MSKGASYEVYLYVMVDSASTSGLSAANKSGKPLSATFQQTSGGGIGPYKAAEFPVPSCESLPTLSDAADPTKVSTVLTQYLIRVGDDSSCLYDPNFLRACNPPLAQGAAYRFKYLLVDRSAGVTKDQTLWSQPIKTKKLKQSSTIDTWPGHRSGGMIVIACVLSVVALLLVVGFLAAMLLAGIVSEGTLDETRYESRTTQQAIPQEEETSKLED